MVLQEAGHALAQGRVHAADSTLARRHRCRNQVRSWVEGLTPLYLKSLSKTFFQSLLFSGYLGANLTARQRGNRSSKLEAKNTLGFSLLLRPQEEEKGVFVSAE